jgi:hypothetical protein
MLVGYIRVSKTDGSQVNDRQLSELEPHVFLSEPVSAGRQTIAALSLCNPHFHNCAHVAVGACAEFKELERCFMAIAL